MKNRSGSYSIVKLISTRIQLLYLATVCLSLFYFIYFAQANYSKSLEHYKQLVQDAEKAISFSIESAIRHLDSIVYEASNSPLWFTENPYEHMLYYKTLEDSLAGSLSTSSVADAMVILPRKSDIVLESHIMDDVVFKDFLDTYNRYNTILPQTSYFSSGDDMHLVLSKPIRKRYFKTRLTQTVGTMYVTIPMENLLSESLEDIQQMIGSNKNGSLQIYASTVEDAEIHEPDFACCIAYDQDTVVSYRNYRILVNPIKGTELFLIVFIPVSSLYSLAWSLILFGMGALLIILLVVIGGIKFINKRIRHPINSLIGDVHSIQSHGNGYRLKKSRSFEITEISDSINQLLDELERRNDLILRTRENLRELRLLHRESQLLALQAQINPHFLYNTLECIRSIAQGYNADEISDILDPMISIYRYSASSNHMGTIESEIACVKNYARIIGIRFDSRIRIEIVDEASVGDAAIPRMVLQPIVENAVNHGYENTLDDVVIRVQTGIEAGDAMVSVSDWGVGMTETEHSALMERITADKLPDDNDKHIGLRNVHQRIRREFGKRYGVSISSTAGKGTVVTIRVPFSRENQT
ncbi:MAG: sensor histidine kinase [Peptococcales bacterium]|jgi:sensor histidine kinase YesM